MAMYLVARGIGEASSGLSAFFVPQSQVLQVMAFGPFLGRRQQFHTIDKRMTIAQTLTSRSHSEVKPFEEMPGPKPSSLLWSFLPLVGDLKGVDLMDVHFKLYDSYGPIVKFAGLPGRPPMVITFRPEDAEVVFRNEGPWPSRGSGSSIIHYREVTRKDFYDGASGVMTQNGPKWLETRRKVNPPLMQPRISKRYVGPIADVAQEFVDRMRTLRDEKDELPANFDNELFKWSLESIAYVALDTRLGCLDPVLSPDSEPQRMIDAVSVFFECLFELETGIPFWKIFPTPTWIRYVKALDTFHETSVKYVDEAIERLKHRSERDEEPSVLERLLARTNSKDASVMAQDMMFGGVDTTSYTVAAALYMISKNQGKQEMLFKELKRFLPKKDDVITDEMLEDMKYLKAILKETLRMESPFNGLFRVVPHEVVLSNYKVPAGTPVSMPSTITNFSEDIFPQSRRFIPERWLKSRPTESTTGSTKDFDSVNKARHKPFSYLPFGFGTRSCIGKRFAEMEIEILLAKIVRNFQVEYNYGDIKYENKILRKPKDPLRFKLTERQ